MTGWVAWIIFFFQWKLWVTTWIWAGLTRADLRHTGTWTGPESACPVHAGTWTGPEAGRRAEADRQGTNGMCLPPGGRIPSTVDAVRWAVGVSLRALLFVLYTKQRILWSELECQRTVVVTPQIAKWLHITSCCLGVVWFPRLNFSSCHIGCFDTNLEY
jgi:hypothetical protein